MDSDKIKEKFQRIFRHDKHSPRHLDKLNEIYEAIRVSKKPIRISEISALTKIKKESIRNYISKYLEKEHYVRKSRTFTPPYLLIESQKGDSEFIYGKDNRNKHIQDEKEKLIEGAKKLGKTHEKDIESLKNGKLYNSQFFKLYNLLADKLIEIGEKNIFKLRIGSGANRYQI